jgi:flagellar biosynthesis chaperone FliJ
MDWDAAINIVSCTFRDHSNAAHTIHQTINPLDKLVDLFQKEKEELKTEVEKLRKENDRLKKGKK